MGGIFSRRVVVDLTAQFSNELKAIDDTIQTLQARKQKQLSFKRRVTRAMLLYGSLIWMLLAAVLYVVEFPNRTHVIAKCMRIGPLILWPLALFLLKAGLDSYFVIQFKRTDAALVKLEQSKETKLDELMARTNFKETQKLISQFSEKKKPEKAQLVAPSQQQIAQQRAQMQQQQQQHQQHAGGMHATPQGRAQTLPASAFKNAQQQMQYQQQMQQQMQRASVATSPVPDTKAPGTRTGLDKILDFVLNDGPNNKYALICTHCYGHNGLVQEQEVGKMRYRCALCGAFNGPPLPPPSATAQQQAMLQQRLQASAPSAPSSPDGTTRSSIAPLTPFEPLSPPAEESPRNNSASYASVAAASGAEGSAAVSSIAAELQEEGEPSPAESPSRTSSAQKGSRRAASSGSSSAAKPANSDNDGAEDEEEDAYVNVSASKEEAPRRRRSQRTK